MSSLFVLPRAGVVGVAAAARAPVAAAAPERRGWSSQGNARDVAAAESFLRRALEALLDLGRHVLAIGLGEGVLEYKQIALALRRASVLDEACGAILFDMAGCRKRLTHFYDEVTTAELFDICARRSSDILRARDALLGWLRRRPELVDGELQQQLRTAFDRSPACGAASRPARGAGPRSRLRRRE